MWTSSPVGIVETDLDQRITACNAAFAGMVGRRIPDVVGEYGWTFIHPDRPANPVAVRELIDGSRSGYTVERLLRAQGGTSLAVKMDWSVLRDRAANADGLACFVTDVSVESAAAAALDAARSRAEVLWDRAPVGIIEGTPAGVIKSVNDATVAMLGWSREDLVGTPAAALADPAYTPEINAGVAKLLAGQSDNAERRYLHADGHSVPVLVSTAVLHDDEGRVTRLVGFVVDMTQADAQRDATEEALAKLAAAQADLEHRHAFSEALLDNLDVGIVSSDASGDGLLRNRAARAMLGLGAQPSAVGLWLQPQDTARVLTASGRPLAPDEFPLVRVLRGEPVQGLDLQVGPRGGPLRDVMVNAYEVLGPDGTVLGAVVAMTDVSVARGATRELAQEHRNLVDAEQRAVQANRLFEAILSATPDYTFVTDLATGGVVYGSPGKQVLGMSSEQLQQLGASVVANLIHPEDRERLREINLACEPSATARSSRPATGPGTSTGRGTG